MEKGSSCKNKKNKKEERNNTNNKNTISSFKPKNKKHEHIIKEKLNNKLKKHELKTQMHNNFHFTKTIENTANTHTYGTDQEQKQKIWDRLTILASMRRFILLLA